MGRAASVTLFLVTRPKNATKTRGVVRLLSGVPVRPCRWPHRAWIRIGVVENGHRCCAVFAARELAGGTGAGAVIFLLAHFWHGVSAESLLS
jgi:hypothetical protein